MSQDVPGCPRMSQAILAKQNRLGHSQIIFVRFSQRLALELVSFQHPSWVKDKERQSRDVKSPYAQVGKPLQSKNLSSLMMNDWMFAIFDSKIYAYIYNINVSK